MEFSEEKISSVISGLSEGQEPLIYLDSQYKGHKASGKSYLAYGQEAYIKAFGDKIEVCSGESVDIQTGNPWQALKSFQKTHKSWLFGYLGYDLKNYVENLDSANEDKIGLPDLYFFVPKVIVEISEPNGEIKVIKGEFDINAVLDREPLPTYIELKDRIDSERYFKKIEKAKEHIKEGDFYEINISHQMKYAFKGKSFDLYRAMKNAGPVPFGAYMQLDEMRICCASPERFLSNVGKKIVSQPIKGTLAKNGKKVEPDVLKNSTKDRAENLMIVDLVRNDIGRIAEKGTVKVNSLFEIQEFETVFQMVSTIEGQLKKGVNIVDAIAACFPMGSMTGAPKIRAMKVIEELEDYKRGLYSGAIGYMTPDEDFDFNVVIRTAIIKGEELFYSVGGAITSDSELVSEWDETLAKARALEKVIEQN